MAEDSAISWTDSTFNPWRGCSKVSAGCARCYAEALSHRNPGTLGVWGPQGTRVMASEFMWKEPYKWQRQAKKDSVPHRVFCASLADVFEDWPGPMTMSDGLSRVLACDGCDGVPASRCSCLSKRFRPARMDDVRKKLFHVIRCTPDLTWLLLTKRPENVSRMTDGLFPDGWPPNIWLGTSVENQEAADTRIPHLLSVPAAVRFLSCEPLLGPVDLERVHGKKEGHFSALTGRLSVYKSVRPHPRGIDWVIAGGESGAGHRPMELVWAHSLAKQCRAAGVKFFCKQDSGRLPGKQGRIPLQLWERKEFPACSPSI